jgi:competence protein ComEA
VLGRGPGDGLGPLAAFRERLADRVPSALRASVGNVPSRAALAAVVLAVALLVGLLARGWAETSGGTTVPRDGAEGTIRWNSPAVATSAVTSAAAAVVVVDVVGRVRHPGVVRLAAGSRVVDAVQAAGGTTKGAALRRINLARPVVDGEQIVVPGPDDPLPQPASSGPSGTANPGVDLNHASESELEDLPGIGPVLAERIVQWRAEHGRFTSVDELAEVDGIGQKLLTRLRPLVRV